MKNLLRSRGRQGETIFVHAAGLSPAIRCGLLAVCILLVAAGIAFGVVVSATSSPSSEGEKADDDTLIVAEQPFNEVTLNDSADTEKTDLEESPEKEEPKANSAITQAIDQMIGEYAGCVSVAYVPLSGRASAMPSAMNIPLKSQMITIEGAASRTSASMIKLIILAELFDEVARGVHTLDEQIVIDSDDMVGGTGIIQTMGVGTALSLGDIARFMIAESDNVATNKIIDLVGMDAVNAQAAKLGLEDTMLQRKMIDEVAASQGRENYTSANDVATLLSLIACGEFVDASMSSLALDFLRQQSDTDGVIDGVPADIEVAHKTGALGGVEHDGAIVLTDNPYILVVMTEGLNNTQATTLIGSISRAVYEQRCVEGLL